MGKRRESEEERRERREEGKGSKRRGREEEKAKRRREGKRRGINRKGGKEEGKRRERGGKGRKEINYFTICTHIHVAMENPSHYTCNISYCYARMLHLVNDVICFLEQVFVEL